jgi:MFS family permease
MHLIVASAFAANVVGMANFQYLPLYIRQLGGSIENLAFFFTVQTVVLAALVLVGGWLVDRFNRRLLFSLTPALAGMASLLHALAPTWEWLIPGLCLNLLSMSIGAPIFFSMTSDLAPRDRRAAFFGYQAMAFSICGIVGPLVGGYFFEHIGYRWFLTGGAVLAFTASYLRALIRDPREDPNWVPEGGAARAQVPAGTQRRNLLGDFLGNLRVFVAWARKTPGVVTFMVLINLPSFGGKMIESYFSVYHNEIALIAPTAIGTLFAISGAMAVPANLFGGRFADRIGRKTTASVAWMFSGLWIMVFTMVTGFPAMMVLFCLDGLVHGGMFPSIDAWNADLCPSRHRGTFAAMLRLTGLIIAIPAPGVGAWLWATLGPVAPLRLAAVISVLTGLLLFRFAPSGRLDEAQVETVSADSAATAGVEA